MGLDTLLSFMGRRMLRAGAAALLGSLAGAASLVAAYSVQPGLTFEMDRDLPRLVSGFYPTERAGHDTFAWASGRARLSLPGVNRSTAWTCTIRFRGGRPGGSAQPLVELATDGVPRGSRVATNTYEVLEITAPPSPTSGLILAICELDDVRAGAWRCARVGYPGRCAWLPPFHTRARLAALARDAGRRIRCSGLRGRLRAGRRVRCSGARGCSSARDHSGRAAFDRGGAVHDRRLPGRRAGWLDCFYRGARRRGAEWRTGSPLRPAARFALAFTAAALYVKLLALLHPSKPAVDVVFQAHRLEWVLDGRLFFTQPMPSGVEFPYTIALYVFAAPWSLLTRDYVTLLRVTVCACEALVGGLLYVMIARTWNDRRTGAVGVALFSLVPISYSVIGNANLTNAFGQSASVVALAVATLWSFTGRAFFRRSHSRCSWQLHSCHMSARLRSLGRHCWRSRVCCGYRADRRCRPPRA